MNNLRPIGLKDPRIKFRSSSPRTSRKVMIGLLAALIVAVMIVWVGFLGWGVVEALKTIASLVESLWTAMS